MTRVIAAAGALLAITALAAGCGSSQPTSDRLRDAIRSARHAYRGLAIFPLVPSTIHCRIPPGGTHPADTPGIPGRCTTSVRPVSGKIQVVFFERGTYPTSGNVAPIALGGRWVVTVGPSGAVQGYTVTGDPPQLQK